MSDAFGAVSVLIGNGNGTFMPRTSYAVGSVPYSVACTDINQDGNPDLVTANLSQHGFTVLLGSGTGTFGQRTDHRSGTWPSRAIAVDVDSDGWKDILLSTSFSLSAAYNRGDGTFAAEVVFPVSPAHSVAVDDYDQDGDTDLAVCGPSNVMQILAGSGEGTFELTQSYSTGSTPLTIATGQLNYDGCLDLVTANDQSATVSIFLGDCNGNFSPRTDFPAGPSSNYVAIGDFNEDGHSDLVVSNYNDYVISILIGNGDGSFQPRYTYPTSKGSAWVDLGDLNEDGHVDIVVANRNAPKTISRLLGNGDGTFGSTLNIPVNGTESVCLGDVNEDGHLDLATVSRGLNSLYVMIGDGTGQFGSPMATPAGKSSFHVHLSDLNADGHLDAAVSSYTYGFVTVLLGEGDGSFNGKLNYGVQGNGRGIAVGYLNNDTKPDLACVHDANNNVVSVLFNIGEQGTSGTPDQWTASARLQAYPNPFRSRLDVSYEMRQSGMVHMTLHDASGRLVSTLMDEWQGSGMFRRAFDPDSFRSAPPFGMYFLRLSVGDERYSRKVIRVR